MHQWRVLPIRPPFVGEREAYIRNEAEKKEDELERYSCVKKNPETIFLRAEIRKTIGEMHCQIFLGACFVPAQTV